MKFCQMSNKPLKIGPDILQISVVAKFCRIWSHWLWHNHYTPSPLPEFYLEIFFNSAAQKVINFFPCLLNLHFMVLFLSPSLCLFVVLISYLIISQCPAVFVLLVLELSYLSVRLCFTLLRFLFLFLFSSFESRRIS